MVTYYNPLNKTERTIGWELDEEQDIHIISKDFPIKCSVIAKGKSNFVKKPGQHNLTKNLMMSLKLVSLARMEWEGNIPT